MASSTAQWTTWNLIYDDSSPLIAYSSLGSDPTIGWAGVILDNDSSYHYTSQSGASFELQFSGSNLTLYGSSNASYKVTFDGSEFEPNPNSDEGILVDWNSLYHEGHNMSLTVDTSDATEQFRIDKAVVTSNAKGTLASPNVTSFNAYSPYIGFQGAWKDKSSAFTLPSNSSIFARATSELGDTSDFTFSARAIAVYGPINSTSGRYSVRINGDNNIYNASSPIVVPETLLAVSDLHAESETYTISLTNLDSATLSISRIDMFQFSTTDKDPVVPITDSNGNILTSTSNVQTSGGSTPSSSSGPSDIGNGESTHSVNIGVILGPILGGLAFLMVCGLLLRSYSKRKGWSAVTDYSHESKAASPYTLYPPSRLSRAEFQPLPKGSITLPRRYSHAMTETSLPASGAMTSAQSTVERLLYLIANQIDSNRERHPHLNQTYGRNLPPYPESAYVPSQ